MKTIIFKNKITASLIVLFLVQILTVKADTATILKAMNDEMQRSLNELQYEDYSKPFFISYNITDAYTIQTEAKLGALIRSDERNRRNSSARLMVGNYELNDENWVDKTNRANHNDGYLPLPDEDDYLGIRRSFWIMSNNIYKSAAESYKNKKTAIEQKSLTMQDLVAPDFSKANVVEKFDAPFANEVSKTELDKIVKNISVIFLKYPDIIDSKASVDYQNCIRYFINSEGSKTVTPFRFFTLKVSAAVFSKENFKIEESLIYYGKSINDLPTEKEIIADAELLVQNIKLKAQADQFFGSYLGPVLFKDMAINELLLNKIFKKGQGLIAQRRNLEKDDNSVSISTNETWDDKKEKKVVDSKLTFYSIPKLKTYNGVNLLGEFNIDLEAVIPTDSLLLINKGKLVNQFNNRIPTPSQLSSNGHVRFYVNGISLNEKIGPDVVFVKSSETQSNEKLIEQMNELANEEGLDYVFEISSLKTHANCCPMNYYKIDLKTGKKTLFRSVKFNASDRELLSIEGISDQMQVTNTLFADIVDFEEKIKKYESYPPEIKEQLGLNKNMPDEGTPTSLIYPNAILFKQIELSGISKVVNAEKPIVPYHLAID